MTISFLDLFFAIILIGCIVVAGIKGFVKSCLSKVAFVFSILIAITFTPNVEGLFRKWISNPYLTTLVAFVSVLVVALIVLFALQALISKVFSGKILGAVDHSLGCVWGLFLGVVIVLVFLILFKVQPFVDCTEFLSKSFIAKIILPFLEQFEIIKNGIKLV